MITKEYLQQELAKRIDGYKRGVATTTDNIIAEMKSILVLVDALQDRVKDYDDALKRAKDFKNGTVQFALEPGESIVHYIFPELRESEDENLKNKSGYYKAGKFWKASTLWNATKDKIPQRVSNRYILQECTWNIGTLQEFADEIKNIQEVSLDYPIILDINGNILDGAHRVVKAYLEGKDIDIVYLGDDEWPEPDYDEEKSVRESEDERIRKELIEFIKWSIDRHFMREDFHQAKRPSEWIAYLEKQEEFSEHGYGLYYYHNGGFTFVARPAIEEEKQKEHHIPWYDYQKSKDAGYTIVPNGEYEQLIKQKEQNPAWSEEDEKMRNLAIEWAETMYGQFRFVDMGSTDFRKIVAWLKSLRPQSHWKPSEEQMEALKTAKRWYSDNMGCNLILESLFEQLEKLM